MYIVATPMQNIDWIPICEPAKNLSHLKQILLENRKMDKDLIEGNIDLKSILRKPEELNFSKKDTETATDIINNLRSQDKGVIIHGDYDVDGITSTAILYELFTNLGFKKEKLTLFVPNRFEHGYGFSNKSLEHIENNFPSVNFPLLILVDCGITAIENINKAKNSGYKIIVIDHHQKKQENPKVDALFWNSDLTTSILSFFFSKYIEIKILGKTDLFRSVDFAGMGYVSDLGNLNNPIGNIVTREALRIINTHPRKGIQQILDAAGIEKNIITSYDLGWVIGPRLNSSGRLTDPLHSLNLLLDNS